jgi:phage FluMu protein gp41
MASFSVAQARARARRILEAKAANPEPAPEPTGPDPIEAVISEIERIIKNPTPLRTHPVNRRDRRQREAMAEAQRPQSPAEAERWAERGLVSFQRGPRAIEKHMAKVDVSEGREPEHQGVDI